MRITSVSASNIKGKSFTHELGPAVAIVGPNFTNKSTIPDTIRLALIGHLPEVGKREKATWELSSGEEMEVTVEFDDLSKICREFYLRGDTIRARTQYWDGNLKPITDENHPLVQLKDLPLLDNERYSSLTDTERTNYVFDRIKLPDIYSPESIIAGAERLSLEEDHTEQVEKAKQDLMQTVRTGFNDRTVQDALTFILDSCAGQFTYWNKRAKDTQGAVTTLTELKLRENEISAETLAELKRQTEAAVATKSRLDTELGGLQQQEKEVERVTRHKAFIKETLESQPDYDAEIAEEKAKLKPVPKNLELAKAALESRKQDRQDWCLIRAQQSRIISDTEEKLAGLDQHDVCPYCKSKNKGWKETLINELAEVAKAAARVKGETNASIEAVEKKIAKLESDIATAEANQRNNVTINARIEQLTRSAAEAKTRIEQLKSELAELEKFEAVDVKAELVRVRAERDEAAAELSRFQGKVESARQLAQDLKRAAQAELEHQDAKAHVAVIKLIAGYLKEKRTQIVEDVFGKLLETANKLCEGILRSPLALHENTIGRWNESKFIPHRVFSGTEKVLAYIAIAVALSTDAPFKLVILDELARLTPKLQTKVLHRLEDLLTDKVIDQALVIIPADKPMKIPGWQIINT